MPGRDVIENRENAISDFMDLENTLKNNNATALQLVFLSFTTASGGRLTANGIEKTAGGRTASRQQYGNTPSQKADSLVQVFCNLWLYMYLVRSVKHYEAAKEQTMREPRRLRDLTGYRLNVRDGEIGELEEVYFDDEGWVVRYFVVRTGSWLLGRSVLIVPAVVKGIVDETKSFDVDLTREQVQNSPPIDTKLPVSRHYEQEYYRYYGWEPYWSGLGPAPYTLPLPKGGEVPKKPMHPHLQSSNELESYRIHAVDGDIGHLEDVILEDPGWAIRYLEVDTRNWLPGKHVLLAPAWIRQVDWAKQEVRVDLTREAIETAPRYDPTRVISRDYQMRLYEHYGKKSLE